MLQFDRAGGRTVLTRARAASPLRLLSPRRPGDCAWAISSTLGGGLVAGDNVRLDVRVGDRCAAVLGTQASTKVYCSPARLACRQEINAQVGDGSLLIVAPDPVTCFAGSVYEQRQRFELAASAALVVVDWITSGRWARGERWNMTSCRLRTDIFVVGRQVVRDALLLGDCAGEQMGRFNCWGNVIIVGDRLAGAVGEILRFVAREPVRSDSPLIFAAGPIPGGMLLRIGGESWEQVLNFFRRQFSFLPDLAGEDPWGRKG